MSGHCFNFKGGDKLSKMGASWFVSYSYYLYINKSHINWQNVSTCQLRIKVFNKTKNYHQYWLRKILEMNDNRLNKYCSCGSCWFVVKKIP
jgi:uncharacterized protein YutD